MTNEFFTYLHCKPDLTPFYVGKGTAKRCYELTSSRRSAHHQNIVAKYGKENIIVITHKRDSEESAFEHEKRLIRMFRRNGYELCNMTDGGEGSSGCRFPPKSIEWKARHSEKMTGRKASSETKAKMSESHKGSKMPKGFGESVTQRNMGNKYAIGNKNAAGRKHTEEEKLRRGAAIKEAWAKRINRSHSEETKAKLSAANKGRKHTEEAKAKISANSKSGTPEVRAKIAAIKALKRIH